MTSDNIIPVATMASYESNPEGEMKVAKGVDDALVFQRSKGLITWTEEEERRVLKKIDHRLLPLLFFVSLWTYMDSQGFGLAAIFGMIKDLNLYEIVSVDPVVLDTNKYSWAASIPSFGVLVSQYPLLIAAQHLPLGKFCSGITLWSGFFAIMMIALHDFPGTMVVRFLYGFQGIIGPITIIYCVMWWKTDEQPLRIGIWTSGAACGGIVGQAFDYAAVQIHGAYANSPWKWIYVLLGSVSIAYAFLLFFILSDSPMKAGFLTERERQIAVQRLQKNNTGIQTRQFKSKHVREAVMDFQAYLIIIMYFSFALVNTCIGSFAALIVTSFGYGELKAIQLLMPMSGIAMVVMILSGGIAHKFPRYRLVIAASFLIPSILGACLLWKMPRTSSAALLAGLYLTVFFYGAYIQVISLLTSNIAGHTKKISVNAMVMCFSCVGSIIGPFVFKGTEAADGYPTGMITMLSLLAITEVLFFVLMFYYKTMNSRKLKQRMETPVPLNEAEMSFLDLTDKQNPYFVYSH